MAQEQFANRAETSLSTAITAGQTSILVSSAAGFPTTGQFRILIDNEWMLVTSVAGSTFTVQRGVEGSTAASHGAGSLVVHTLTAGAIAAVLAAQVGELSLTAQAAPLTLTNQNQFYLINQWNSIANQVNATGNLGSGSITVGTAGWWKLAVVLSGFGDAGSPTYEFSVFINGVEHTNAKVQQVMNTGTTQSWSISDVNQLNAGDVVDVRVRCTTAAGKQITLVLGNFILFRIGS